MVARKCAARVLLPEGKLILVVPSSPRAKPALKRTAVSGVKPSPVIVATPFASWYVKIVELLTEPTMDVAHVARAVAYMASLPLDANVLFLTVMATQMPLVGRG